MVVGIQKCSESWIGIAIHVRYRLLLVFIIVLRPTHLGNEDGIAVVIVTGSRCVEEADVEIEPVRRRPSIGKHPRQMSSICVCIHIHILPWAVVVAVASLSPETPGPSSGRCTNVHDVVRQLLFPLGHRRHGRVHLGSQCQDTRRGQRRHRDDQRGSGNSGHWQGGRTWPAVPVGPPAKRLAAGGSTKHRHRNMGSFAPPRVW